jgi:hypothetical protein
MEKGSGGGGGVIGQKYGKTGRGGGDIAPAVGVRGFVRRVAKQNQRQLVDVASRVSLPKSVRALPSRSTPEGAAVGEAHDLQHKNICGLHCHRVQLLHAIHRVQGGVESEVAQVEEPRQGHGGVHRAVEFCKAGG